MLASATLDQTRQIAQRRNGNETSEAENAKSILAVRPLSFGVRELSRKAENSAWWGGWDSGARDLDARLEALRTGFFRRDAVRFVMVGSLGFTIEFGILVALMHGANWSPFLARAVAMAAAFFCT